MNKCSAGISLTVFLGAITLSHADVWWQTKTNPAPSLVPLLGTDGAKAWAFSTTNFAVANIPGIGDVLTAPKEGLTLVGNMSLTGDYEARAMVRLPSNLTPSPSVSFFMAKGATNMPTYQALLSASKPGETVSCTVYPFGQSFSYILRAYRTISPGWPEDFRVRIEHDMAALPGADEKWVEFRAELRQGSVRFWLDDHLVTHKTDPAIKPDGTMEIRLGPGTQLASFRVTKLDVAPVRFEPIPFGGYANARAMLGDASVDPVSLPPANQVVNLGGVPFVFSGVNAEGNDHIDVGRSLYRQANMEGYVDLFSQGPRYIGSAWRDPARIQLRIPNGQYDSLYLVAAADDEGDSVPLVTAMFYRPSAGFAERFEGTVPLATAKSAQHPSPYPLPQGEREKDGRPSDTASHVSSPLGGEDKGEGYARATVKPLPVMLSNGKKANLWLVKIPLDPGRLSSFGDMDIVEVELTKQVHQFRSYPDPILYGWHQAGLPSAVHVYAATLGRVPVSFGWQPDQFGHVWTAPAVPSYTGTFTNQTDESIAGKLTVTTRSYDGTQETKQEKPVTLAKGQAGNVQFSVPVKLNGYHDIVATLEVAGRTRSEKRSFVRLAPDTRSPRWEEGKGALFGYWSYHGGHETPPADEIINVMTMAGARVSFGIPNPTNAMAMAHWARVAAGPWEIVPQEWAKKDPYDPAAYDAYKKQVVEILTKARDNVPEQFRPDHVHFFPEPTISLRLTMGNYPEYWNEKPYEYTEEEKANLRQFMVTSKCAAEAIREKWPNLKIMIPWGDPLFVVPMLRAGFPKNLIDGAGLDNCGFERLPEQQLHQISLHRLYTLRKEFEKAGIPKPQLLYNEGIFVPTEPGAVSWREQMDIYHRWALISLAYGVDRFYAGWFAFDCGNFYGSEHYGGCGIQRRIPYCDPKPAYAAFATMTDKLNQANYDGWLKMGSLTSYGLKFKGPKGNVYALWTLRGKRPVTLTLAADAEVGVTDSMNNTKLIKSENKKVMFTTDPSVIYVTGAGDVVSVEVGEPDHSDVTPAKDAKLVADLADGSWKYTSERDLIYENNNFDTFRYPGKFSAAIVEDPTYPSPGLFPNPESIRGKRGRGTSPSASASRVGISSPTLAPKAFGVEGEDKGEGSRSSAKVLVSKLEKQDTVRELMPWYNTLTPSKPIALPGAPSHIGLWVKGASDWGRVIYRLRDAKGERWISIGTKDQWNCDDLHSWSAFNFDGWRYVRFELPGHTGYDNFRKHGTTWWRGENGDGIVDQPLALESIIVEQRTHVLYVNDVQPARSDTVAFGKLFVEYASPTDATDDAVRLAKLRMPLPKGTPDLPNPIAEAEKTGVCAPTTITKLEPPSQRNDGSSVHVHCNEVAGAKSYHIWCSAHADGRGAVNMTPSGASNGQSIGGLRPALPLYFWVTYQDANGAASKPSKAARVVLVDEFKEK